MSESTTRQQNLNAAAAAAAKRLKEAHIDQFNEFMVEEAKARGEKWAPRPTPEQKAEAELRALLEANPSLYEKVLGVPAE
jgi:predicted ArsR family transcriptional regulator